MSYFWPNTGIMAQGIVRIHGDKMCIRDSYNTEEERRKLEEETENLVESFRYITKGFETAKYFCDQRSICLLYTSRCV